MKKEAIEYFSSKSPYSWILVKLRKGAANGVHLNTLMSCTMLDGRRVRKCIEQMRRSGIVILSDRNGYYFPATIEELQAYRKKTEKTAKSIFYTLKAVRHEEKQLLELENNNEV